MPVLLKEIDDFSRLEEFNSVLIIPCRFCPAASMAVRANRPYFEFHRSFLKTAPYERLIADMKSTLENMQIRADVFETRWLHQFALCMWSLKRRKKLKERARKFDALVVLGCEAAVETVLDAVKPVPCAVFQGMRTEGIMNIQPKFQLPSCISIRLNGITPLLHQPTHNEEWACL